MPTKPATGQLDRLVTAVRTAATRVTTVDHTAQLVAAALRENLPTRELLTPEQLGGSPDQYTQYVLHAEPDGLFSVVALVWRPGQATPIHDHLCWCVVGVVDGVESEVIYELVERDGRQGLVPTHVARNEPGEVCAFAPPGDIHEVRNAGETTAVSLHVYGADITSVGSSIRRRYAVPVFTE